MFYWIKSATKQGTIEARDAGEASIIYKTKTLEPIVDIAVIPYPAEPVLYQLPAKYPTPAFCTTPETCKGRTSCPKRYACSE